jgi:apolipoprotein N-acyltransferase
MVEFTNNPNFLFTTAGLFVFFSLIWVMKEAKSARKLYLSGTSIHLISVFWIFFGPSSHVSNTIGISLFFFGTIIMTIALTEEFITDGVRAQVDQSKETTS